MSRPRIVLGDDHGLIIEGLQKLLEREFDVVGIASNGRDLVILTEQLRPAAVLLDVSMPLLNGIEAARQIHDWDPKVKLIFVTQKSEREYLKAALRIGASGYLLKQSASSEISRALHTVMAGGCYVTPSLRESIPDALFDSQHDPSELFGGSLTPRQREVLQLIAEGKSNKEIAGILGVSIKTVDFHKAAIGAKLGLHTTADLTRYAVEQGIVGE